MGNNIEDLRAELFKALEALNDPTKPLDIDRAKAVSEISQVIINSAKVEVEFMKTANSTKSKFFNKVNDLPNGITGITQHLIK